jgi:hypothetical protein
MMGLFEEFALRRGGLRFLPGTLIAHQPRRRLDHEAPDRRAKLLHQQHAPIRGDGEHRHDTSGLAAARDELPSSIIHE